MLAFEIAKLAFIVLGAAWCLSRERHDLLLSFIGLSLGLDIVQVDLGPTLTGPQIFGLVYLPRTPRTVGQLMRTRGGRTLIYGLALLLALVVVYGYLLPWPDKTGERPWTQRAEGRSIINFGATISYISMSLYIAACSQVQKLREKIPGYLLLGTSVASLGVVLEVVTKIDFFSLLATDTREWVLGEGGRARGFNGEPRASGSLAAMGIVLLLRPDSKGDPKTIALLLLHAVALTLTTSTLGLMLLLIGTMTLLLVTRRLDVLAAIALVGGVAFVAISAWFGDSPFAMWAQYTGERVAVRQEVIGSSGFEDSLVQSLEIFDASALNFLFHRPEHFVFGAGPGMVSLPASDYIPPGGAQLIFGDRIDSIPFMGVLRAISDSGFVGLGLWLLNVLALIHALRRCEMAFPKDRSWTNSRVYFLVFAVLYLVQTRPAWYVWLGVGLAAALQERELELLELAKAKERRRKLTTRSIPARAPAVEHS